VAWTIAQETSVPVARLAPVAGVGTAWLLHDLSVRLRHVGSGLLSYERYLREAAACWRCLLRQSPSYGAALTVYSYGYCSAQAMWQPAAL
jgi:hypothetical protein